MPDMVWKGVPKQRSKRREGSVAVAMRFMFVALKFQCTGVRGRAERARCVYVEQFCQIQWSSTSHRVVAHAGDFVVDSFRDRQAVQIFEKRCTQLVVGCLYEN